MPEFFQRLVQPTAGEFGLADLGAARVALQPVDQAILLRPVVAAYIKNGNAITRRFGERAVSRLGEYRIDTAQQVGKVPGPPHSPCIVAFDMTR